MPSAKTKKPNAASQSAKMRRARFIVEYRKDFNATQAAIRAGYAPKHADVTGPRLLGTVGIREEIARREKAFLKSREITAERVKAEIALIAYNDPRMFFDADGQLLPVREMPEEAARALEGFDVEELFEYSKDAGKVHVGNLKKVKFGSKLAALNALTKILGMVHDRLELTGKDGGPLSIVDARAVLDEIDKPA